MVLGTMISVLGLRVTVIVSNMSARLLSVQADSALSSNRNAPRAPHPFPRLTWYSGPDRRDQILYERDRSLRSRKDGATWWSRADEGVRPTLVLAQLAHYFCCSIEQHRGFVTAA